MTTIPYGGEGVPSGVDTQEFSYQELLAGHIPEFLTVSGHEADGATAMAAFTVVGLSGGVLVPATEDKTVQALGILAAPILANATTQKVGLIRGGNFRAEALVFDASYDTDAKKLAAFEGAPSPTQIVLQLAA